MHSSKWEKLGPSRRYNPLPLEPVTYAGLGLEKTVGWHKKVQPIASECAGCTLCSVGLHHVRKCNNHILFLSSVEEARRFLRALCPILLCLSPRPPNCPNPTESRAGEERRRGGRDLSNAVWTTNFKWKGT